MNLLELFLCGLSLSMDAFSISICKGLASNRIKDGIKVALYFGFFQFIMPILGFYLGNIFSERIINYNPYISMILLVTIGILMFKDKNDDDLDDKFNFSQMFLLSIATSIDALVIGISFSFLKLNIISSSLIIGIITFIMCFIGFFLGHLFNRNAHQYANKIGGLTLIIIGIKIFIETIFL